MKQLNIEIFEQIAFDKGCDIAFPLKEKMLIEVISQLISRFHNENGKLIFGGGTSLVSAYGELTKRFSEDADFRFVPCPKSTKNIRVELVNIANTLDGFKLIEDPISDSHKIEFRFEDSEHFIREHSSLRPYIKLEVFFTDNLFYIPMNRQICSCYNKCALLPAETEALCVSLQDTAIDKISSFLWRIYSDNTPKSSFAPADMRHLHDLYFLTQQFKIDDEFKQYVLTVANSDIKYRLKENLSFKDVTKQVLVQLKNNQKYQNDFIRYVKNMSYAKTNEQLNFDNAYTTFATLLNKLSGE